MLTSILIWLLIFVQIASTAEFNKTLPATTFYGKNFNATDILQIDQYGPEIYIEEAYGIVQEKTFRNLQKVTKFMMYHSYFTKFEFQSLYQMIFLESIDLIDVTGFATLTNSILLRFKNLKRLSLYNTDIKFEYNTFQHLGMLEYLSISKHDVSILGNELFVESNLEELYWTNSGIERVDRNCFAPLRRIKIINLSNNKIVEIAHQTFNGLIQLERLYLNQNKLVQIEWKEFSNLPQLKYFDVSMNKFLGLEAEAILLNIPTLKTICIDGNSIASEQVRDLRKNVQVTIV